VFDIVVSTVEGLPRPRRRDPDALAESVRRAVRRVIGDSGAEAVCLVHVLTVVSRRECDAGPAQSCWRSRSRTREGRKNLWRGVRRDISPAVPLRSTASLRVVTLPNTKIEFIQPLGETSPIAKFLEGAMPTAASPHCYDVPDIIAARDTLIKEGARVLGDGVPQNRLPRQAGTVSAPEGFSGALVEIEQA